MQDGGGLPELAIPKAANRDRITGSQVYGFLKCEHAVWLDFFGDRDLKLPASDALEHLLARGRDHEERIVSALGWEEPEYRERDFAAGADATRAMLEAGVDGVSQGVLWHAPYLGIPDLLRRESGTSRLGEWHYVVGDIKSSHRPRSDQALQVVFYSCLLAEQQGRMPEYGYLVLRDGSEERFSTGDLLPVLEEVLTELGASLTVECGSRAHRSFACRDCGWREVCGARPDVYWIPGLTRSVRGILDRGGFRSLDALALVEPRTQGRKGLLPEATWQRARWGAEALRAMRADRHRTPRLDELRDPPAFVTILRDGFDRRFPVFAWTKQGTPTVLRAETAEAEVAAMRRLIRELGDAGCLCHAGGLRASLYEFVARSTEHAPQFAELEARCVDLMSIVRGAWVFPAPVRTPREALAWIAGEPAEPEPDLVALRLAGGDWDGLECAARDELASLAELCTVVRGGPA